MIHLFKSAHSQSPQHLSHLFNQQVQVMSALLSNPANVGSLKEKCAGYTAMLQQN